MLMNMNSKKAFDALPPTGQKYVDFLAERLRTSLFDASLIAEFPVRLGETGSREVVLKTLKKIGYLGDYERERDLGTGKKRT